MLKHHHDKIVQLHQIRNVDRVRQGVQDQEECRQHSLKGNVSK